MRFAGSTEARSRFRASGGGKACAMNWPKATTVLVAAIVVRFLVPSPVTFETLELDGISHRRIAKIVRVEMVSTVQSGENAGRHPWVTRGRVEVDHRVVLLARSYPVIDRLTLRLNCREHRRRHGALQRRQRRT